MFGKTLITTTIIMMMMMIMMMMIIKIIIIMTMIIIIITLLQGVLKKKLSRQQKGAYMQLKNMERYNQEINRLLKCCITLLKRTGSDTQRDDRFTASLKRFYEEEVT